MDAAACLQTGERRSKEDSEGPTLPLRAPGVNGTTQNRVLHSAASVVKAAGPSGVGGKSSGGLSAGEAGLA